MDELTPARGESGVTQGGSQHLAEPVNDEKRSPEVEFEFELSYLESIDAYLSIRAIRLMFHISLALALGPLLILGFVDLSRSDARALVVLAGFLVFFVPLLVVLLTRSFRASVSIWWPEQRWRLSDRGVLLDHGGRATTEVSWSDVRSLKETRRFFLLQAAGLGVAVAPKRVMDEETREALRAIFEARPPFGEESPATADATGQDRPDGILVEYDFRIGEAARAMRVLSGGVPAFLISWKGLLGVVVLTVSVSWPWLSRALGLAEGPVDPADVFFGLGEELLQIVMVVLAGGVSALLYSRRLQGKPQELVLDEDGIRGKALGVSGTVSWNGVSRATETDKFFFFSTGKITGTYIPKRALHGTREIEEIRALLQRRLGVRSRLLSSRGAKIQQR